LTQDGRLRPVLKLASHVRIMISPVSNIMQKCEISIEQVNHQLRQALVGRTNWQLNAAHGQNYQPLLAGKCLAGLPVYPADGSRSATALVGITGSHLGTALPLTTLCPSFTRSAVMGVGTEIGFYCA